MRAAARRPDEDRHPPVKKPYGDEAVLAVVLPVVLDGQRSAREHLAGTGRVESMIVTLQDLALLGELEWSRAEFLGMMSCELSVPLTSIKGSTVTLLGASPTLDPAR